MPNDSADRGVGEAARDSEQSNTARYTMNPEAALSATGAELQHGETTLRGVRSRTDPAPFPVVCGQAVHNCTTRTQAPTPYRMGFELTSSA
jgi:hypothetical protein